MSTKIKEVLNESLGSFETIVNKDESISCLKDDTSDLIKDNFRDLIHGTEFLPDNYRFETAENIASTICEYDFTDIEDIEQCRSEICDGLLSIYNSDLTAWLASHSLRQDYCDEAMSLKMSKGEIVSIIQCGQYLEIDEIFQGVIAYCEEMTK